MIKCSGMLAMGVVLWFTGFHGLSAGPDSCRGSCDQAFEMKYANLKPLDLLQFLREQPADFVTLPEGSAPDGWITASHVEELWEFVECDDPAAHAKSYYSSNIPKGRSTIGREAIFMIEGFRVGVYPPQLHSAWRPSDVEELRKWWKEYGS